ncbi:hypothetical protein NEAUS03_0092 [Nematocida ausubeli]|nr:hypothetical protein NEAUS03_0092 [Nematocida ausubeli]
MRVISEYLFAIDQWKLLEQWKIYAINTLPLGNKIKDEILQMMEYRSVYDMHINVYRSKTYKMLSKHSGQLKYEIQEYSKLEKRMLLHLNKLRFHLLPLIRHDICYLKYFICNNVEVKKFAKPAQSKYYTHILELLFIEEFSPAHVHLHAGKLHIYLRKSLFINIDIRSTLGRADEVLVVAPADRALTPRQKNLLRGIFGLPIRQMFY